MDFCGFTRAVFLVCAALYYSVSLVSYELVHIAVGFLLVIRMVAAANNPGARANRVTTIEETSVPWHRRETER